MSKPRVILPDTNTVLRYLLLDVKEQSERATAFFETVRDGHQPALLLESVLVECVYVLTKHYRVPQTAAASSLRGLLDYRGFVNDDREELITALEHYGTTRLDIVDCLLLAKASKEGKDIFSFDTELLAKSARRGTTSKPNSRA